MGEKRGRKQHEEMEIFWSARGGFYEFLKLYNYFITLQLQKNLQLKLV